MVYVLFEVGTVCLDGVFEMWPHQRTIQRYEDLLRQACNSPFYEVQHSPSFIGSSRDICIVVRISSSVYLSPLRQRLDDDWEGFYMHLTESPIYTRQTKCLLN